MPEGLVSSYIKTSLNEKHDQDERDQQNLEVEPCILFLKVAHRGRHWRH